PSEAASSRAQIEAVAADTNREIDPEHFGVSLAYARDSIPAAQLTRVAQRRPGVDPTELIPVGYTALRTHLERFIDVGFSKFVVRPAEPPTSWPEELDRLAEAVLPLQT